MSISPNPSLKTFLRITWNSKQLNLNFQSVSHLRQSVKRTPVLTQSYGFSSSHIQMWQLDYKEGWALKNWCFQTVLEETLEIPLDCKIKPVNPYGNHSWIFIERTDAKAEAPILWPPDANSWLTGKDTDAGKIEGKIRGDRGLDAWMVSLTQWTCC